MMKQLVNLFNQPSSISYVEIKKSVPFCILLLFSIGMCFSSFFCQKKSKQESVAQTFGHKDIPPSINTFKKQKNFNMSSIMRGDQTVSLIQQYHAHYPEIARNTQDVEGRKQRVHMWAKITEALNAQYSTNFTVEQFKKKVQNVQCTSRQKMQSGKRNLGDAEMEYMRLFEQDRLNGIDATSRFASFAIDDYSAAISRSRSTSRNGNGGGIIEDFNANSLGANCKLLEMSLGIKSEILSNNNNKNSNDEEGRAAEADDDELRSRSTPSTSAGNENNGGILNASGLVNTIIDNISNGNGGIGGTTQGSGASLANLDNAQQLLLTMVANYSSQNNGLNSAVKDNANSSDNNNGATKNLNTVAETLLATIKNAACRKRTNLLGDNNNIIFNNNNMVGCTNKNNNNGNTENLVDVSNATAANNENINNNNDSIPAKRRRKQAHALHLSNLRPVEASLRMVSPSVEAHAPDMAATSATTAATSLGTPNDSVGGGDSLLSVIKGKHLPNLLENWNSVGLPNSQPTGDNQQWRSDVTEMQKMILDNQRRILDIIERQTLQREQERELRLRRVSSPPSPPLNARQQNGPLPATAAEGGIDIPKTASIGQRSETILQNLCEKIEKLANSLVSIDATIKCHFRLGTSSKNNSADDSTNSSTVQNESVNANDKLVNSQSANAGEHLINSKSTVSISEDNSTATALDTVAETCSIKVEDNDV